MKKLVIPVLALSAACQSPARQTPDEVSVSAKETTVAAASSKGFAREPSTVWEYLHAKYDANGDDAVALEEYDRGEGAFARLDGDRDGRITASDFRTGGGMMEDMLAFMAQMLVMQLFDDGVDSDLLHIAELEEAVGMLDVNFDGAVDVEELSGRIAALGDSDDGMLRTMLSRRDPYETLASVIDEDGDGALGRMELLDYFIRNDDGDMLWESEGRSSDAEEGERPPITSGVAEGEWAPDFELAPPTGGDRIRLSSFRGSKPVALIFGSYT